MVVVQGNYTVMNLVAQHETVRELVPNFEFRVELEAPDREVDIGSPEAIEWNINWVWRNQW